MMEFYEAYRDYQLPDGLHRRRCCASVAQRGAAARPTVTYQGTAIDLAQAVRPPDRWSRRSTSTTRSYADGRTGRRGLPARRAGERCGVDVSRAPTAWARLQLTLFEETTEDAADRSPTFIVDYPAEVSPLARAQRRQPGRHRPLRAVHHRPRNRQRLLRAERPRGPGRALPRAGRGQGSRRRGGDVLRRRLHPRAGIRPAADRAASGIGIDRLVMLLTDSPSIRDVILFPQMRPE